MICVRRRSGGNIWSGGCTRRESMWDFQDRGFVPEEVICLEETFVLGGDFCRGHGFVLGGKGIYV